LKSLLTINGFSQFNAFICQKKISTKEEELPF